MKAHGNVTLVLGGTGKTGRRVVERLRARDLPVRVGSRSGAPPFDWEDRSTWAPALEGVGSVYLTYYPDLAVPGAVEAAGSFAETAVRSGVSRLALLSGRGEPEAERAEQAVRATGADLTILRSTWFMQNFSEDYMLEHVRSGEIRLPAGDVPTPFLDADDIADVAVAALTDDRHIGQLYELTGPRSLTFVQAAAEIAQAAGRKVRYTPVSLEQHEAELAEQAVADSGARLTVVRSTWFAQNFSEDYMLEHVLSGEVALPAGNTPEPFVDADDIADVAVAAL
ncbi:MAG: NAD(P)H-binding protein, partial [Candidatus Limnocylindria bacterium]